MGSRRQSREWALQFLFQRDYDRDDIVQALEDFWTDKNADSRSRGFAEEIIYAVEKRRDELDALISRYAEHWDVKRMGGVDRNVMRIALYEMLDRDDIPPVVSIDEAVEIAKVYSSNESGKFVNGVLDRALRDIQRPARAAQPPGQRKGETADGHVD